MRLPLLDDFPASASPARGPSRDLTPANPVALTDTHNRRISYLRLSLTKACSMRCIYCRPHQHDHPRGEAMLTVDEIEQLVAHLITRHNLAKVRLTGGDPTSRPELTEIIRRIAALGIRDLAMTTNGLTLPHRAAEYAAAGLKRINISLDSLDPRKFEHLTGVDGLERVLDGIEAVRSAGLGPIKLNAVVIREQNETDMADLVRFAADRQLEMRFIELMPMGPLADVWADRYVPEARMVRNLTGCITSWEALPHEHDSARRYRVTLDDGRVTTIGFITPMSCNFCASCNRIRIAADGGYYPCLMDSPAGSLLPALRPRFSGDHLDQLLAAGLAHKSAEHPATGHAVMTNIGG
jgi:cyclic pyranopterin phosphate synthase